MKHTFKLAESGPCPGARLGEPQQVRKQGGAAVDSKVRIAGDVLRVADPRSGNAWRRFESRVQMRIFKLTAAVIILTALAMGGRADVVTKAAPIKPVPTGLSHFEVGTGTNAIKVFTYKPKTYRDGPLVLVFHGVLRNAEDYCHNCIPLADRWNALIAAPLFTTNRYDNEEYQRGGVVKKGVVQPQADWTYLRLPGIVDTIRQSEGKPALPYYFIGHSGGAQFLMRLAALYPMEAKRIVVCNPGSDLFPRRDWKFGYGFGNLTPDLSDDAALQRYLAAPMTLCLGLNDVDPHHPELDRSSAAEKQGPYRLARGRACFDYAQKLALDHGWQFNWRKIEVPGIAHDGKAMLSADAVESAMFADVKTASATSPLVNK